LGTELSCVRRCVPLLLVLLGALLMAGAARASSLVYVSNDNVWLANPDGSGQYQVTLDGTAGDPYREASQADDGTIVAVHGNGASAQIVRMTQNGTLLNTPFTTTVPDTGPLDAVVSPDGSKVAYWGVVAINGCPGPFYWCPGAARTYQVSDANQYVDPSTFNPSYAGWSSFGWPAWLGSSRSMLFTNSGTVYGYDLGAAESGTPIVGSWSEPFAWFLDSGTQWNGYNGSCCEISFEQGAASPDGTKLAFVVANGYAGEYEIVFYTAGGDLATGDPPATPTLTGCYISPPDGSSGAAAGSYPGGGPLFNSLSWSPDGSSLAYEYNGAIYVATADLSTCSGTVSQVIASAGDPSWGPANVNPAPRPVTPPSPQSPTPPSPTPPGPVPHGPPSPVSTSCVVPHLKGDSLAAARRALIGAHCALGKVRRPKRPHQRPPGRRRWALLVAGQSPRPGTVKPAGASVQLKLAYIAIHA
jgi:Tol biopolymer transport system component